MKPRADGQTMSTPGHGPLSRAAPIWCRPAIVAARAVIPLVVLATIAAGCGVAREAAEGSRTDGAEAAEGSRTDGAKAAEPDRLPFVDGGSGSETASGVALDVVRAGAGLLASAAITPDNAPTGSPYQRCVVDYRTVDWTLPADRVVADHRAASALACTEAEWYQTVAFQNGILGFMALVGEAELAAAAPASPDPADMAASLLAQGFDRLAVLEVAASGRCEAGEVQAAIFVLDGDGALIGLDAIVAAATSSGATVTVEPSATFIAGGGAPCATAIVRRGSVLAWITAGDTGVLREAVDQLRI